MIYVKGIDRYGMFKLIKKGSLVYYIIEEFEQTGLVRHCFTTKEGGVSGGIYKSMNLRFHCDDARDNVMKNFEIIADELGTDKSAFVLPNQVHEDVIRDITEKDRGNGIMFENKFESADALITGRPDTALVTFFADCVPIFFLDTRERVICSVHSGWRGTVKKIASKAIDKMISQYNCRPENILAAIGPSIGVCHYEVSNDVADCFAEAFSGMVLEKYGDKYHVNMQIANRLQMLDCGISEKNIIIADICTYCNSDLLFSHRYTNGRRGNMAGVIMLI